MLERVLDLAVYAVLLAMVALGATRLLEQRRTETTILHFEALFRAATAAADMAGSYGDGQDMVPALLAGGTLPPGSIDRENGVVRNAFGGTIRAVSAGNTFRLATDLLPPAACIAVAGRVRAFSATICINGNTAADCVNAETLDAGALATMCVRESNSIEILVAS